MESCQGCSRSFKSIRSLNSHKRFCIEWKNVKHLHQKKQLFETKEELLISRSSCPLCNKVFKNVYSMSAHKGHCLGKTPKYEDFENESKNKMKWNKGKVLKDLNEIFCEYSSCSTGYAKNAILKLNLKEYKCEICKLTEWNDKKLTLELDHINGNNRDHRLSNLRFLCPNCHSQTKNWRGRNKNSGKLKVSDEELINALKENKSIRQALICVGLSPKGENYKRCKILKQKM